MNVDLNKFKELYLGVPKEPNYEAYALAEEYHETCEQFDLVHCTGRSEDVIAIPINGKERIAIEKHARKIYDNLCSKAESLGCTKKEFQNIVFLTGIRRK
jgi:hypothetical protein